MEPRTTFNGVNSIKFNQRFKTDEDCYSYIAAIKWENDGNSFIDLHVHIMNLKGWLRGIHHHCSKERLQGYLDEYHYRYNRRNNMDTIFDLLLKKMVINEPIRLSVSISKG